MTAAPRLYVHHCTSQPAHFFGRQEELSLLDAALDPGGASVIAFVGPGGQGKTAIMQHWLGRFVAGERRADAVFLWSFYRGKDADLCLRELYGHAIGSTTTPEVSATYAVDHLLTQLRRERWVLILDGAEVAQQDTGPWFGRFVHPELSRLLEELAMAPLPGVVVLTTRFPLPELARRRHARIVSLSGLDADSACGLLQSLGVTGSTMDLISAADACGRHAKAVELLGTFLVKFHDGTAAAHRQLPEVRLTPDASDEEQKVARVLSAYGEALPREQQDILALATAFRDPPTGERLLEYLASQPVRALLHETWRRPYVPFAERPAAWLADQVQELVALRLLERVGLTPGPGSEDALIDAHPLVRRAFEHNLGATGRQQSAQARAGFLHGRPDRRRPATLEEAREEIELFHAYCDAGLWPEADAAYAALDRPRYRFLTPSLDRDLLLRFFPDGDWQRPPLWSRFARWRDLAIDFELLGRFDEALPVYRASDAPLRGDSLLALGRITTILESKNASHPWQMLWGAYRAHALCLAGRVEEAVALTSTLVPMDVYEWTHVFECLLRADRLDAVDMASFLYRPAHAGGARWADLARQRMRADFLRLRSGDEDLDATYRMLIEEYDRGGLPWERGLTRLSYARWLLSRGGAADARAINVVTLELATRYGMRVLHADALAITGDMEEARQIRKEIGYVGPERP
jgi:hypothetical protein